MLANAVLEGVLGPRAVAGGSHCSALGLVLRVVRHAHTAQQPASAAESPLILGDWTAGQPCCSSSSSGGVRGSGLGGDGAPSSTGRGGVLGGLQHKVLAVLQRRGISTTPSTSYEFKSNLTRYVKSKVANRDNFQRWRDSGRDVRVAQDILREEPDGTGERRGRRGRSERRSAMAELRSLVLECRDLQELQVVVRECGSDMDGQVMCVALSRLSRLKQATPAAAAPAALARRIAEALLPLLQGRTKDANPSNLAAALHGLAEAGVLPSRPLLEQLTQRLLAPSPRGGRAATEADPKALSSLMLATNRMRYLQRLEARSGGAAAAETAGGNGAAERGEWDGDALGGKLWPALVAAAEAKLLRALGEEPADAPAAPVGREDGPEVDDSMPQASLRAICKALTFAQDRHPGVWTAAARLAARHAAELDPAVAASVLRSYAAAGGSSLDGGREGLMQAIWAALEPRLRTLQPEALQNLTLGAAGLAADPTAAAAAAPGDQAAVALQALRPLCDALVPWLPKLDCGGVVLLATALAKAHGATAVAQAAAAAGAAPAAPAPHPYGALPRLMADLLLLRGVKGFGARGFASVALALGLLGHADVAFWDRMAASATPELPRMDGSSVSRLLGALQHASHHAAATAAAAAAPDGASPAAPAAAAAALAPPADFLAAAHARVQALLDGADAVGVGLSAPGGGGGGLTPREAFFALRCLAEWPLPEGGKATLTRLADCLTAAAAGGSGDGDGGRLELAVAQPATLERMARALRDAGLGEHPLLALLEGGRR